MTALPGRAPLPPPRSPRPPRDIDDAMPEPTWYPPTPPRETITCAGEEFPSMTFEEFQAYEASLRGELPDEPLREATGYRDNPRESTTTPALPLWRRILRAIGVLR